MTLLLQRVTIPKSFDLHVFLISCHCAGNMLSYSGLAAPPDGPLRIFLIPALYGPASIRERWRKSR